MASIGPLDLEITNALLNLISQQPYIDNIYLYAKDPCEGKLLINSCKSVRLKRCNNSKYFIEYSSNMDGIYENTEKYSPNNERKMLLIF